MNNNTPNSNIERRLEEFKDVPSRNPLRAASGRTRFLNEAAIFEGAVSPEKQTRQSGWIFPIRKEKLVMNALVSLLLSVSLLLGGGGAVAAAQNDLPNQSLYQLKLWTENATMAMTGEPQEQAELLMSMAQKRVQEMAALAEQGITPPDQVRDRLQQHLDQALQLATDMDEATREGTLLQLRDCLQTQDRIMEQLQLHVDAETEPLLTQTRQMLQTRLQLVDEGLADLQGSQHMMNKQQGEPGFYQNNQGTQTPVGSEDGQNYNTPGSLNSANSNNGNGKGDGLPGILNNMQSGNSKLDGHDSENSHGGNNSGSGNNGGDGCGCCCGNH
jgi:hypothetical protein